MFRLRLAFAFLPLVLATSPFSVSAPPRQKKSSKYKSRGSGGSADVTLKSICDNEDFQPATSIFISGQTDATRVETDGKPERSGPADEVFISFEIIKECTNTTFTRVALSSYDEKLKTAKVNTDEDDLATSSISGTIKGNVVTETCEIVCKAHETLGKYPEGELDFQSEEYKYCYTGNCVSDYLKQQEAEPSMITFKVRLVATKRVEFSTSRTSFRSETGSFRSKSRGKNAGGQGCLPGDQR